MCQADGAELFEVGLALAQVVRVVAGVSAQGAVLEGGHVVHTGVHEGTVVGDDEDDAVVAGQEALEPLDALEVEGVGGLVEQQDVGVAQQQLGEADAHLPAAGELEGRLVEVLHGEPQAAQDLAGAALELVAAGGLEAVAGAAVLLHGGVEGVGVLLGGHDLLELGDALAQVRDLGRGGHDLLEGRAVAGELRLLLEVAHGGAPGEGHGALVGRLEAHDDLEQRGLAGAVGAHEGPGLAGVELDGGARVEDLGAEGLCDLVDEEDHGACS